MLINLMLIIQLRSEVEQTRQATTARLSLPNHPNPSPENKQVAHGLKKNIPSKLCHRCREGILCCRP